VVTGKKEEVWKCRLHGNLRDEFKVNIYGLDIADKFVFVHAD
jgi:hypothetical protein